MCNQRHCVCGSRHTRGSDITLASVLVGAAALLVAVHGLLEEIHGEVLTGTGEISGRMELSPASGGLKYY